MCIPNDNNFTCNLNETKRTVDQHLCSSTPSRVTYSFSNDRLKNQIVMSERCQYRDDIY
jgi:hypothetical protein